MLKFHQLRVLAVAFRNAAFFFGDKFKSAVVQFSACCALSFDDERAKQGGSSQNSSKFSPFLKHWTHNFGGSHSTHSNTFRWLCRHTFLDIGRNTSLLSSILMSPPTIHITNFAVCKLEMKHYENFLKLVRFYGVTRISLRISDFYFCNFP